MKTYTKRKKLVCPECGKVVVVYYNLYGTTSGGGNCACGKFRIIIN